MAKAIALYRGNNSITYETAVREDGSIFRRYKRLTAYGMKWSRWEATGRHIEVGDDFQPEPCMSNPTCILTLVRQNSAIKSHRDMFNTSGVLKVRLPN